MIKRAFLVAAAAVAFVLSPTAAMAQVAQDFGITVSDSTPSACVPFTVNVVGAGANEPVTLGIHGAQPGFLDPPALSKNANAIGAVAFSVTLTSPGPWVLEAISSNGALHSSVTVTVSQESAEACAAPRAGRKVGADGTAGTTPGGQLAFTGFEGMSLAVGGGVLLFVGAGAVVLARRRKSAQVAS